MIEIKEAKTRKQQKEFLMFPINLYRGNPNFVPPLWGDEKQIFNKNYHYYERCEAVYYNAYKDGAIVGRISGILQKDSNLKRNEKRIRFTRFDCIEDFEVAKALFEAVEKWGLSKGMDTICGPLGFSDLEREGLLIEGFDQLSTFEEQYNASYYGPFIERLGYAKEVDWTESKIYKPEEDDGTLEKMSDFILRRYNLHLGTAKNINDFLKKYADGIFDLIDRSYDDIYGTVPFTKGMKDSLLSSFRLIIDLDHVAVILDENEKMVCFGLCFPSIAKAVQKSDGHLTPAGIVRVLRAIRKPSVIDLALVGVDPQYANRGISTVISAALKDMLSDGKTLYAETNLNLEYNYAIQNQWKRFKEVKHKRRRSYVKSLEAK